MRVLVSHRGMMLGHQPSFAAFADVLVWRLHHFEGISLRVLTNIPISRRLSGLHVGGLAM